MGKSLGIGIDRVSLFVIPGLTADPITVINVLLSRLELANALYINFCLSRALNCILLLLLLTAIQLIDVKLPVIKVIFQISIQIRIVSKMTDQFVVHYVQYLLSIERIVLRNNSQLFSHCYKR
jgi:hypothetical protein